jgi:NitT/TauT family transport system ATP-binding protein
LLDLISGLENPSSGKIYKNGSVGYMFQKDNLLNWLNILDNVLFGIKIKNKIITENDITRALLLLEKYDLIEFQNHYPYQLSGGMKQRVSLIRTLMTNPDILLLDEPFSSLDSQTKLNVIDDVYKIIKNENKTTILVTHDINEAISFSNKIYILNKRPSTIIKELEINIEKEYILPFDKRNSSKFNSYFNEIWSELNGKL